MFFYGYTTVVTKGLQQKRIAQNNWGRIKKACSITTSTCSRFYHPSFSQFFWCKSAFPQFNPTCWFIPAIFQSTSCKHLEIISHKPAWPFCLPCSSFQKLVGCSTMKSWVARTFQNQKILRNTWILTHDFPTQTSNRTIIFISTTDWGFWLGKRVSETKFNT